MPNPEHRFFYYRLILGRLHPQASIDNPTNSLDKGRGVVGEVRELTNSERQLPLSLLQIKYPPMEPTA